MSNSLKKVYVLLACAKEPLPYRLEEDIQLAQALGLTVVDSGTCFLRHSPSAATFIGRGWVEKIGILSKGEGLDVIIDAPLSPSQQRNLERAWQCVVWDRTRLILAIFSQRARTSTGKLQVELAHLLYQKSHLVKAWQHLERQRGGFGFMAGPGELQIEIDRRLIQTRIFKIQKQLEKVKKTRALHRKSRKNFPIVTLIGYTNAGKSTLFRCLTHTDVLCADMPFATLDPVLRKIRLPSGRFMLLSDTVGFISDLPQSLRLAFQATLEEILYADLLLHVRDIASPYTQAQKEDVLKLLCDMQCHVPVLEILNKVDKQSPAMLDSERSQGAVAMSALQGKGIGELLHAIDERLGSAQISQEDP